MLVADTYEKYLLILRTVDKHVYMALGWDTPNWRVRNACRACCYKVCNLRHLYSWLILSSQLEDEPSLQFSRLWALDGNNSLKRMAPLGGRDVGDSRILTDTNYFLPREYVNQFSTDIPTRKPPPVQADSNENDDEDNVETTSQPFNGDPTNGEEQDGRVSDCARNWKAAASDEKKKMWGIFDETGIFASACRHGLILWLVDMVKSGELWVQSFLLASFTLISK